jgi:hypothetical protein
MRLALLVLFAPVTAVADNVLVPEDLELHATKEAALVARHVGAAKPIAMRLVREHGEVVELQTGDVVDCADSRETPYKLTVFVLRTHLYGRIKAPMKHTFSDGTALVLDRGAPVFGLDWAKRPIKPTDITIAVRGAMGKAQLPNAGTELVCDGGPPMAIDEWMAKQRSAKPAKPAPKSPDPAAALAELVTREVLPPPCNVRDNILPTVDGKTVVWPSPHVFPASVRKIGGDLFADVHLWCGRARMKIEETSIGESGSGGAGLGGVGRKRTVWIPKAGKVTWPDGKPAGTYAGGEEYEDVEEIGDRICVSVPNVAERVCHPKKTTKQRD